MLLRRKPEAPKITTVVTPLDRLLDPIVGPPEGTRSIDFIIQAAVLETLLLEDPEYVEETDPIRAVKIYQGYIARFENGEFDSRVQELDFNATIADAERLAVDSPLGKVPPRYAWVEAPRQ